MLVILAAVYSKKSFKEWAPLAIGITLGFIVMVGGPLTGGSFNPARWFGPALVGNEWGGVWPYLVGPIVGSLLAAAVYRFVIEAGGGQPRPSRRSRSKLPAKKRRRRRSRSRIRRAEPGAQLRSSPSRDHRAARRPGWLRPCSLTRRAPGHLLAQLHALALADLPVLLQVLRLRDAPGARPRAGGGRARASTRRVRRNTKELLVLTGERPEVNPEVAERLRRAGATRTSPPTSSGPASGRSSAACSRTRTSACSRARGPGAAARGDRLAGPDAGVDLRAADGDGPRRARRPSTRRERLATIEAAGELRIPFTTRDPGRHRRDRGGAGRVARSDRRGPRRATATSRR